MLQFIYCNTIYERRIYMKIPLPCKDYVFTDGSAEIRDWILYIHRPKATKEVMYKITYMIHGDDECYYCHRKRKSHVEPDEKDKYFEKITIDHLYSQEFGGLTIPQNMRPCCERCNLRKGNLFEDEFEEKKRLPSGSDEESRLIRANFDMKIKKIQEERRMGMSIGIPEDWLTPADNIRRVNCSLLLFEGIGAEYRKQKNMQQKNKYISRTIMLSSNLYVLDGFYTILLTKMDRRFDNYKISVLDNVVYDGD